MKQITEEVFKSTIINILEIQKSVIPEQDFKTGEEVIAYLSGIVSTLKVMIMDFLEDHEKDRMVKYIDRKYDDLIQFAVSYYPEMMKIVDEE